jgi:two-component system chemotaxis sensor kinase CheA
MDDMSEYKEMFAVESAEHLQSMNEALLGLEKDPKNSETINVMFRAAHTLKGMSATMGYSNIKELTHNMENLMDRVRKNELTLDSSSIDLLFECLDVLEKMVENPEKSSEFDVSALIEKISSSSGKRNTKEISNKEPVVSNENIEDHEIAVNISSPEKLEIAKSMERSGCNIFEVSVTLHESCMLKSARSTVVIRNLSELGEIIETIPPVKDLEDEKFDREFKVIISTKEGAAKIEAAAKKVSEISKVEVKPYIGGKEKIKIDEKTCTSEGTKTSIKSVQSVRVSIERLDSLMNLVGELIINKIRLMQLASTHKLDILEEALASLNRLTNDLQEEIMASRMVPIEQIFNRFPRMIRDLAKKEEKDIDLILLGGDIELDRTVLDEIGDPLVHILRNCVDHGIEMPQVRKQCGKKSKGTITLTARREKNHVVIEAQDDGKGIDPQKMRDSAIKKGLMSQEEATKLSDTEAINLSFLPGFSTAEIVTDISGRGVGMDVVRTKIGKMGGSIKLDSIIGKGTTIKLKLPLTVAIIHSLMVKVGTDIYAIPITNVIRDLSIKKEQIKTIKGEEVILIRGEVLPLVWLHKIFGIKCNGSNELLVVVVERAGNNIGLVVDEVIGQQEVIIKNLDNNLLKGVKGFAGATILGDGNVALILDVGTLF